MFRNTWSASVGTELSIAPAAWSFDSMGSPLKTVPFGSAGRLDCLLVFSLKQTCVGLPQHVRRHIFVCQYPGMVTFGNSRSSQRGSEVERFSFPIEVPEP
jgi:hypothetical protein